jgi:hypothetical protein
VKVFLLAGFFIAMGSTIPSSHAQRQVTAPSRKELAEYAVSVSGPQAKDFIRARCVVHQPELSHFEIPCPDLMFKILDSQSREVRRVSSQEGTLNIKAEKEMDYFLVLESDKYRTTSKRIGPATAGESLVIEVEKIN